MIAIICPECGSNEIKYVNCDDSPDDIFMCEECKHEFLITESGWESIQNIKATMNVAELSKQLGISKPKAYELVRQNGFPCLNIGRRIIIPVEAFNIWLMKSSGG